MSSRAPSRQRPSLSPHAWPLFAALLLSIPAFYAELLEQQASRWVGVSYVVCATLVALAAWFQYRGRRGDHRTSFGAGVFDGLLVAAFLLAAVMPSSLASTPALVLRLIAAGMVLMRTTSAFEPWLIRGHLGASLVLAAGTIALCGVGYWKLEPTVHTLSDGLWLAFVTASTVGFGDFVPTVTASRVLSIFVVMLGFGVLSLVTASVAARWVEREEREIEREVLQALHQEVSALRKDLAALRADANAVPPIHGAPNEHADRQKPVTPNATRSS